jgi:hypothetical protein
MRLLPRIQKIIFLVFSFQFLVAPSGALALVNPQSASVGVTATVPDTHPPTSPILVSPANHSLINTSSPVFIFQPSTDDVGFGEYELYIDGDNKQRDNISHAITNTISTTAKTSLSDGLHTWKVRAIDSSGNYKDSATWSFTIDTTPPLILITQVAEHTTNLSSADPSTTSNNPSFTTTDQTPTFSGTSEAKATLVISLTSSASSYSFTTIVAAEGTFSITPQFNLGSASYTVSVSSTDAADNNTSLPSFNLIIQPRPAITIPLPSPLPPITLPRLQLPALPQLQPYLPQALQATPISFLVCSFWPWVIILLLLSYIFYLHHRIRRLKQQKTAQNDLNKPDQTSPNSIS